ncbi:hypothetical protein BDAP_000966 [Binucleata daphniae]
MTFTYINVTIDALNKNTGKRQKYIRLVTNACGLVKKGELLAIMGPSGCGKTSLISALAGRIQKGVITSGEILFNNEKRNTRNWLKMTGFVAQDDQIFEKLKKRLHMLAILDLAKPQAKMLVVELMNW